jgi:hypothetical protein
MFVTNHVLAGALIGLCLPRHSGQAFTGGVVSHVIMDLTPHCGDATLTADEFFEIARRDGLVALGVLAVATAATPAPRRSVLAGVAGAVLLDLDKPCKRFFGFDPFPRWLSRFHHWIQNEAPHRFPHEVAAGTGLVLATAGGLIGKRWAARARKARAARTRARRTRAGEPRAGRVA